MLVKKGEFTIMAKKKANKKVPKKSKRATQQSKKEVKLDIPKTPEPLDDKPLRKRQNPVRPWLHKGASESDLSSAFESTRDDSKYLSQIFPEPLDDTLRPEWDRGLDLSTSEFEESDQFEDRAYVESSIPGPNATDFDIFQFGWKLCERLGDMPKFRIYKNGDMLTTKMWPYSWEKLQAEFGGGYYKVQVVKGSNGQIVKQFSQTVADLPGSNEKESGEKRDAVQNDFNHQMTLLNLFQQAQDRAEQKQRLETRASLEQNKQSNELLIQMIKSQAESSTSGSSKLAEAMIDMRKEMYENQKSMMEFQMKSLQQQTDSFTKVLEQLNKRFESIENKKDDNKLLNTLKELQVMKELMSELKDDDGDGSDEEKDGLGATIIKSLVPVLGAGLANQQAQAQAQAVKQPAVHRPAHPALAPVPVQTRPVPGSTPKSAAPLRPASSPVAKPQAVPTGVNKPHEPLQRANPQASKTVTPNKISNLDPDVIRNKIETLVSPLIAEDYISGTKGQLAAQKAIKKLNEAGFSPLDVTKYWSEDDLIGKVEKSVPAPLFNEALPFLKEFYSEIKRAAQSWRGAQANIT